MTNMKYFVIFATACVVISTAQAVSNLIDDEQMDLHREACGGEAYYNVDKSGELQFDMKLFKDHLLCVSKRIGIQNEAGEIQTEHVLGRLRKSMTDPSKAKELLDKCLVKSDPADVIFELMVCLNKNTHEFEAA